VSSGVKLGKMGCGKIKQKGWGGPVVKKRVVYQKCWGLKKAKIEIERSGNFLPLTFNGIAHCNYFSRCKDLSAGTVYARVKLCFNVPKTLRPLVPL